MYSLSSFADLGYVVGITPTKARKLGGPHTPNASILNSSSSNAFYSPSSLGDPLTPEAGSLKSSSILTCSTSSAFHAPSSLLNKRALNSSGSPPAMTSFSSDINCISLESRDQLRSLPCDVPRTTIVPPASSFGLNSSHGEIPSHQIPAMISSSSGSNFISLESRDQLRCLPCEVRTTTMVPSPPWSFDFNSSHGEIPVGQIPAMSPLSGQDTGSFFGSDFSENLNNFTTSQQGANNA